MADETNFGEFAKLTSEIKRKYWGEGPWVEEPDKQEFVHEGIQCFVLRIARWDGPPDNRSLFGGYFCGYVKVPESVNLIPYANDFYEYTDVHGEITFDEKQDSDHWIGFDCAHFCDLLPSLQSFLGKVPEKEYRDFNFAKNETIHLAEQLKKFIKEKMIIQNDSTDVPISPSYPNEVNCTGPLKVVNGNPIEVKIDYSCLHEQFDDPFVLEEIGDENLHKIAINCKNWLLSRGKIDPETMLWNKLTK